jgi:hypothetical protein
LFFIASIIKIEEEECLKEDIAKKKSKLAECNKALDDSETVYKTVMFLYA